jgi:hypothetical protein
VSKIPPKVNHTTENKRMKQVAQYENKVRMSPPSAANVAESVSTIPPTTAIQVDKEAITPIKKSPHSLSPPLTRRTGPSDCNNTNPLMSAAMGNLPVCILEHNDYSTEEY